MFSSQNCRDAANGKNVMFSLSPIQIKPFPCSFLFSRHQSYVVLPIPIKPIGITLMVNILFIVIKQSLSRPEMSIASSRSNQLKII